jgi:hypothetical protein
MFVIKFSIIFQIRSLLELIQFGWLVKINEIG